MTTIESDRVLAPGVPITLTDGREVRLRFGMRSLKMLEDHFGGLGKLEGILPEEGQTVDGPVIGPLMTVLAAGLAHDKISADDLLDLTDPGAFGIYGEAISKAIAQSFPAAGKAEGDGPSESPGTTSTTPPPSGSDAPTPSSGT